MNSRALIIMSVILSVMVVSGCAATLKDIETIQDQNELAQIAMKNKHEDVQVAATRKISDQKLLANVAMSNGCVLRGCGAAAIERITDQELLKNVYKNSTDKNKLTIVRKITDQKWLEELALDTHWRTSKETRRAALENITDQSALVKVILKPGFDKSDMEVAAAKKLTDQSALAKVAMQDRMNLAVLKIVAEKLTDQSALARIAMQKWIDSPVSKIVAEKLTDQSVLADAALKCSDGEIAINYIDKLNDQSQLKRVALNARRYAVRVAAAKRITDETTRAKIVNPRAVSKLIVNNVSTDTTIPFLEFRLAEPSAAGDKIDSACSGFMGGFVAKGRGEMIVKDIIVAPEKEFYSGKRSQRKFAFDPSKIYVKDIDVDNVMTISGSFDMVCFSVAIPVGSELLFPNDKYISWGNVLFKAKKAEVTEKGIKFPTGSQVGLIFKQ